MPHESVHDDQQLARYLLGLLRNEDEERVDEMSIVDDEVAGRLWVVENDLVDAYVSGTLAGETLERFESLYLSSRSSPRRREKVRFAAGFLRSVDRAAAPADTDTRRDARRASGTEQDTVSSPDAVLPERIRGRSRPSWRFAVAAAVLLSACAALLFATARLRNGLNEAQRESVALDRRANELEQRLKDQQAAHAQAVNELEQDRASLDALAHQSAAARPPDRAEPGSKALTTLAVVLLPQTRAIGPITSFAVPLGTDRVAFELRLESNDFPRYQVALKDPGTNHVLWRSNRITARSDGDEATVSVIVPAGVLKPQHYSFELDGLGVAGGADAVGSYIVRITPR